MARLLLIEVEPHWTDTEGRYRVEVRIRVDNSPLARAGVDADPRSQFQGRDDVRGTAGSPKLIVPLAKGAIDTLANPSSDGLEEE